MFVLFFSVSWDLRPEDMVLRSSPMMLRIEFEGGHHLHFNLVLVSLICIATASFEGVSCKTSATIASTNNSFEIGHFGHTLASQPGVPWL